MAVWRDLRNLPSAHGHPWGAQGQTAVVGRWLRMIPSLGTTAPPKTCLRRDKPTLLRRLAS